MPKQPEVHVLTDAMERFQGVYESPGDANEHLYQLHGAVESWDVQADHVKVVCGGKEYTLRAYTPSAFKYK